MDNRTAILDCALQLFSERGYDAVGIQEICEAAAVTKPTLYHYFNSKRGLLEAVLERDFGALLEQVARAAAYHGDLVLTLERVARAWFDFARERPLFYRLQLAMYFAPPGGEPNQALAPYGARQQALIETLFIQAVRENGNLRGHQRPYAATFIGMIHTYIGFFLNGHTALNDTLVYQAVHQFLHGIL
jgi:AcrR family transcriptional regulator